MATILTWEHKQVAIKYITQGERRKVLVSKLNESNALLVDMTHLDEALTLVEQVGQSLRFKASGQALNEQDMVGLVAGLGAAEARIGLLACHTGDLLSEFDDAVDCFALVLELSHLRVVGVASLPLIVHLLVELTTSLYKGVTVFFGEVKAQGLAEEGVSSERLDSLSRFVSRLESDKSLAARSNIFLRVNFLNRSKLSE